MAWKQATRSSRAPKEPFRTPRRTADSPAAALPGVRDDTGLALEDVRREYTTGQATTVALDGVSLTVEAGEFVVRAGLRVRASPR